MWTPRRVLLLLGGILLFGGVYGFYSRMLGWLDGLPQLPEKMLDSSRTGPQPQTRLTSPTIERIREAFGPDCLEQNSGFYPTQLEFRNGDTSTVLASGAPPFNNSTRMVLSPFSVASFGAPKPEHLRLPGEAAEISTFHADKAILEFDRAVNGPNDMAKAKLLRMELISEPDPARLSLDRRCGLIHITNNQHSTDPGKFLLIRTVGPMFYRDPKSIDPKSASSAGPDIWTDAAVEIIDRQNLPRRPGAKESKDRYRTYSLADEAETAPVKGPDLQTSSAIAEILLGQRLPPPTVSAIGMKIFFDPPSPLPPVVAAKTAAKKSSTGGLNGVRRVELLEKALVNLWVDTKQGLMSAAPTPTPLVPGKPVPPPPSGSKPEMPSGLGAVAGGLFFPMETVRKLDRALLQVDTLGRLTYDTLTCTARFDVLADGNPDLPNDVQVHRVPPIAPPGSDGMQRLFSQFLEIEFYGAPVGAGAGAAPPKPATTTVVAKPPEPVGTSFKQLRAWTEMPGRFVTIISDPDRLEAYGQYLLHDKTTDTTTLRGLPLVARLKNADRKDSKPAGGNILTAGSKEVPATLTLKPGPGVGTEKSTEATVEGPGRFEFFDQTANANTIQASWQTRMIASRVFDDHHRPLDLYTFIDGAMFEDKRSDYWLKGQELYLWMEPRGERTGLGSTAETGGSAPSRLIAKDDGKTNLFTVSSHSGDFDIDEAKTLTVWFRDGVPPLVGPVEPLPPAAAPPPKAGPMGPPMPMGPAVAAEPPLPEPQKPKPPMKIKARIIDTWMVRYPAPSDPRAIAKKDDNSQTGSMKYELEKAVCEGKVEVHQDPAEPGPDKRGVDIKGQTLLVDHTPDGSVMTVTAVDDQHPGEVHHDGMSIIGAKIVIDQLHNTADVEGRGSLKMPSKSNIGGSELKQSSDIVIHWRDRMNFMGARRLAQFFGKVSAHQNDSYVTCHEMHVLLDRPVDFSQRAKSAPPPPIRNPVAVAGPEDKGSPKVDKVNCYPAPEDLKDEPRDANRVTYRDVTHDATGRIVKAQHLVAFELEMNARVIDEGTKEPYQRVIATGPGTLRMWQSGAKDETGPNGKAPVAPMPMNAPKESEMKLTIVNFAGRMTARDYGNIYQDATFQVKISLVHCPADSLDTAIDMYRPPAGSVSLTCEDKLIVSMHKKSNEPTTQRLDAFGNADIRSDEYVGWGEIITSDGPTVSLRGGENTLARLTNRFNRNQTNGKLIVYNRVTGAFGNTGSTSTTIQTGPAKPAPPPVAPVPKK